MKLAKFIPEIKIVPRPQITSNRELLSFLKKNFKEFIQIIVDVYGGNWLMIDEPKVEPRGNRWRHPRDPEYEDNSWEVESEITRLNNEVIEDILSKNIDEQLYMYQSHEDGEVVEFKYNTYDKGEGFVSMSLTDDLFQKSFIFRKIKIYFDTSV